MTRQRTSLAAACLAALVAAGGGTAVAKAARKLAAAITLVAFTTAQPVIAKEPLRTVAVRMDDSHGIPTQTLLEAQEEASQIYGAIGVSLVWLNTNGDVRQIPGDVLRLHIMLLSRSRTETVLHHARLPKTVLGIAPHDTGRVYIFCDRILRRALSKVEPFETILGRVLAHEIGHHLLPRRAHSDRGVMAASLDYTSAEAPGFTDTQAASIRALLAASAEG